MRLHPKWLYQEAKAVSYMPKKQTHFKSFFYCFKAVHKGVEQDFSANSESKLKVVKQLPLKLPFRKPFRLSCFLQPSITVTPKRWLLPVLGEQTLKAASCIFIHATSKDFLVSKHLILNRK